MCEDTLIEPLYEREHDAVPGPCQGRFMSKRISASSADCHRRLRRTISSGVAILLSLVATIAPLTAASSDSLRRMRRLKRSLRPLAVLVLRLFVIAAQTRRYLPDFASLIMKDCVIHLFHVWPNKSLEPTAAPLWGLARLLFRAAGLSGCGSALTR